MQISSRYVGMRLKKTWAALAIIVGGLLPAPAQAAVVDLLPSISPLRSDLEDYELVKASGGRTLLRFPGTPVNHGKGALEVSGRRTGVTKDNTLTAYQKIKRSNGTSYEVNVGRIIYHAIHEHFHLEGVSRYRLLDASGKVVKSMPKVTFCLTDTKVADHTIMQPPKYFGCDGNANATSVRMGISVGWADVYARHLPGQSFDVTDLVKKPKQEYRLEMTTNPLGILREAKGSRPKTVWVPVVIGV